ncbi:hypothetical protein GCM10023189_11050 [Nibrella saemangeumensis]|uniref:Uncharacterized protein n=1 Tax=Nibrella saemangeumensis TaxID=1084526 RepID=A0ABP8MKF6_9BACT
MAHMFGYAPELPGIREQLKLKRQHVSHFKALLKAEIESWDVLDHRQQQENRLVNSRVAVVREERSLMMSRHLEEIESTEGQHDQKRRRMKQSQAKDKADSDNGLL